MIPDDVIQEIKRRVDIGAVIGRTVKLKRTGRNLVGLCPFHAEKSPSFNVRPDEGFYKCFGCDAKGDVFAFLQATSGQDFHLIARQLAEEVGVEIPESDARPELLAQQRERKRLLRVLELTQLYFRGRLRADEGRAARAYLQDARGLGDDEIESFGLGFGGASEQGLREFLEREGVRIEEALAAGVYAEGRSGPYPFFRHRVTFPVRDRSGAVLSFSARIFGPAEQGRPKYVNGPASPVYDKSRALYGLHEALPALKRGMPAVLVEGQLDVIATHRAGVPTGVAVSGTSLTERHIEELSRSTERVVVALDADAAGQSAAERAVLLFLRAGVDVSMATLLDKDPDAMVRGGDAEALGLALKAAPPAIEVLVQRAVERAVGSVRARTQAVDGLLPFLAAPARALVRSHYTKLAAHALQEEEALLWQEVERRGADLLRRKVSGGRVSARASGPAPALAGGAAGEAGGGPGGGELRGRRAGGAAATPDVPEDISDAAARRGAASGPPAARWTDAERGLALALLTHPLLAPRCAVLVEGLKNHELRDFIERLSEALVRFHDLEPGDVLRKVALRRHSVLFELVRKVMEAGAFEQPERLLTSQAAAQIIDDFVRRYDQRSVEEQLAEVRRAMAAWALSSEATAAPGVAGGHEEWKRLALRQRALILSLRGAEGGGEPERAALPAPEGGAPGATGGVPLALPAHLPPEPPAGEPEDWQDYDADWEPY